MTAAFLMGLAAPYEPELEIEMAEQAANIAQPRPGFDWPLAARILLALIGCYVMSAVVAMALARGLPLIRSEATATGTLVGMLLWPCSIVYVFGAKSVKRSATIMTSITIFCALVAWIAGQPTP